MLPNSPVDALGGQTHRVRSTIIDVARSRHDKAAEAHQVADSRFWTGFASQWRDLLIDFLDAMIKQGYQSYKLLPAGYKIPIINNCLVFVWRTPNRANAIRDFASSSTRQNCFVSPPPQAMLWEDQSPQELAEDLSEITEVLTVTKAARDVMPLVLVMIRSTPWQLQSIEWAIATLDDSNKVELQGQETLWEPEPVADEVSRDIESFDSGSPASPAIEPREQEKSLNA